MWYVLIGLIVGVVAGIFSPLTIPIAFARYTAVGILGIFDSILGAIKGDLQGKYNPAIFISGLLFNMILAMVITFLGDRLGIDLYLAVIIVFTFRIFGNIATIRYSFLGRFIGKKRVQDEIHEE